MSETSPTVFRTLVLSARPPSFDQRLTQSQVSSLSQFSSPISNIDMEVVVKTSTKNWSQVVIDVKQRCDE